MCWSNSSQALSRLGLLCGLLSLATLLTAFASNVWLYTREPIRIQNNDIATVVTFKIGLWRVCPTFKRTNTTHYMPTPSCTLIKYSSWDEITGNDLGISMPLEFTPSFLSRMRFSTPFEAVSVVFILMATLSALAGHCSNDHKTLVACGLYMLGGLTLGGGLVIFASVLSDAYFERPRRQHVINETVEKMTSLGSFDYKYGWSFMAAGAAFILSELAAVFTISAYLRRFPTVEDMVRVMVPGAERRLREHQGVAGEYLVQHQHKYQRHKADGSASLSSGLNTRCYSKNDVLVASDLEGVEGPLLLSKTAPDICTSNPAILADDVIDFTGPAAASSNVMAGHAGGYSIKSEPNFILDESDLVPNDNIQIRPTNVTLAGQTVPIVLMHHSHRTATNSPSTIQTDASPFVFVQQPNETVPNYDACTLPPKAKLNRPANKPEVKFGTSTLPSKQFRNNLQSGIATLDNNSFKDQLHKKYNNVNESDGHLTLDQRFGSALSHLSSGLDSGTGTLVGSFHNDGNLIHTGVLGVSSDVPGTSSTASSSSGTTASCHSSLSGKNFHNSAHKKKTVTIGSVFSTMDTFESDKTEDDLFGGASAV